jgi:4-hydroxythreonine-4-phosphate dehydrogenase
MKPRVALLLGDPSGIGPEVAAKLLSQPETLEAAHVLVIGDEALLQRGQGAAGTEAPITVLDTAERFAPQDGEACLLQQGHADPAGFPVGEANAQSGRYVLETLKGALALAKDGVIDSICFAPLNKQAMSLGGSPFEDELHFFAHELGFKGHLGELNTFDRLWTTRVTSHVPLSEVAGMISSENVGRAIRMADETLRAAAYEQPRIAVAALNPHAGDGGLFGREELDVIAPAVEAAQAEGLAISGPFPSDTVFLRARAGDYDAVVTMYHDQGQIAMKLMGFDRGVTVQGGLPIPITTPAHGTAFDIVGKGVANPEALRQAFLLACKMGMKRRANR